MKRRIRAMGVPPEEKPRGDFVKFQSMSSQYMVGQPKEQSRWLRQLVLEEGMCFAARGTAQ
jgi:hypothetical protein